MANRLLIDGYNLLHASEVFASSVGPPTLERTRAALLDFLASGLSPSELKRTTIVFDAAQAPPGLPRQQSWRGMTILFSRSPAHADDLLEEILGKAKGTRELLVVSSDHRVQRAARQSGAKSIDSELWILELRRASSYEEEFTEREEKPLPGDWERSPELANWLAEFGRASANSPRQETKPAPPVPESSVSPLPPASSPVTSAPVAGSVPIKLLAANPFPPGYGEDLLGKEPDPPPVRSRK